MSNTEIQEGSAEKLHDYLKRIGFTYLLDKQPMKPEHSGSDKTFEEIINGYVTEVTKELQHFKDTSIGLHCTDRPDLITDNKNVMFQLNPMSKTPEQNKVADEQTKGWVAFERLFPLTSHKPSFYAGYSLAQQEIAELKKNNQGLHDTLQARINIGIKDFEQIREQAKEIAEAKKEVERLKGLIHSSFIRGYNTGATDEYKDRNTEDINWDKFKTENNL